MVEVTVHIRWRDMDNYGHVNNAVYLNYLEECRDRMVEGLFGADEAWDFVLAHVGIDFRNQLTQDDGDVIVRWGLKAVGLPYVWGGEWGGANPPAALGGQPVPGFDCSGLAWWLLRANDGGAWDVHPPRPYAGWALPQRTSADMARFGALRYDRLLPGDLMFYDGNDDGTVDHVDVYIGNGYALDSSNTPGGVTIMWVGDGWYREHFVHGRRILPSA